MTIEIDDEDIISAVGWRTYEKGVDLWAEDAVLSVVASSDGTKVAGRVQGSRDEPYTQTIHVTSRGGRVRIVGSCSCPIGANCKHVAAVLLQYDEAAADGTLERVALPTHATATQPADLSADPTPTTTVPARDEAAAPTAGRPGSDPTPEPKLAAAASRSVSPQVKGWLDRLARLAEASEPAAAQKPAMSRHPSQRDLVLVLDHDLKPGEHTPWAVRIRPLTVATNRQGENLDPKHISPDNANRPPAGRPKFLTDADVMILRDLDWLTRTSGRWGNWDVPLVADVASRRVLEAAAASGRLRLGTINGPLLAQGPVVRAAAQWVRAGGGGQRLAFVPLADDAGQAVPRFDRVLPLAPPIYVDREAGRIGCIETGLPPALAAEIASAPLVGAGEAAVVKELMRQRLKRPGSGSPIAGAAPRVGGAELDPGQAAGPDARTEPETLLPLPEAPDDVEVRKVAPVPRLELLVTQVRVKPAYQWYVPENRRAGFAVPVARLAFDYAGEIARIDDKSDMIERVVDGKLFLTRRDHKLELAASERLGKLGLKSTQGAVFEVRSDHAPCLYHVPKDSRGAYEMLERLDDPQMLLAFASEAVPALLAEGWQVAYSDDYPYRLAEGEATWWAETGEGSGIDWFSFELGVEFEGHRLNLVPHLAKLISDVPAELIELAMGDEDEQQQAFVAACNGLKLYHPLPDGRLLPLPGERLAPLLRALIELIGPRAHAVVDGGVRLHRAETVALARFAERAGLGVAWAASAEKLIALGRDLKRGRSLEAVVPPSTFRAQLRPYQADGLAWLDFLRDAGFGGVLADDMGLGKTVQALAFLAREKAEGRLDKPAIILAPTSVLPNWQAEAARFAPQLKVLALRGLERRQHFGDIDSHDLVLTTYPLLARDWETLLKHEYHAAILDEAQAIKNPKANVSTLAHRIVARHRIALTGTPLENNLGEVWSLFEFLSPGLLGDESTFRRTFRTPIEKHGDVSAQAFLTRRLKPFMLRRTKGEVAKELPPKTEIVERVRLEGPQRDLYETVRSLMHEKVRDEIQRKGIAKSHIVFLDALLKLRQICCDPRLLKMSQARKVRGSAKLERLMEMLPELVGEGRRILLFSQFTSMLALIEEELARLKLPYVMLTGDTADRAEPVREFQSGKAPLFLLSLKAGGTGLNLTAADTVIHYDPWWNPAVENQATDRAYRIGQDKPVFVYKLIVEEGIEEAIELLKAKKAALAEALFEGRSKSPLDLTDADISALFAPLSDARQLEKAA